LSPWDKYLLITFGVALICVLIFWNFYGKSALDSFMTGFSAGVLGILIAFYLDRKVEQSSNNRLKKDFLHLLRDELQEINSNIYPNTESVYMLYPEIWDSIISSSIIRLFSSEQVVKLTKVYRSIKGTQYEAEWIRRAIEEYNGTPETQKKRREELKKRYEAMWARHLDRGKDLSARIEEILKEKWWDEK